MKYEHSNGRWEFCEECRRVSVEMNKKQYDALKRAGINPNLGIYPSVGTCNLRYRSKNK